MNAFAHPSSKPLKGARAPIQAKRKTVMRAAAGLSARVGGSVSAPTAAAIGRLRAQGGSPLDATTRRFFESRMGQDFGSVRVHTGELAASTAASLGAKAFTLGTDVVFGPGEHRPSSTEGRRLLAHELAHVEQQDTAIRRAPEDETTAEASFPTCAAAPPIPDDSPPPLETWFGNAVLNRIRREPPAGNQTLLSKARGSSGPAVQLVQQALISWGCKRLGLNLLPRFGADGDFGAETERAVKRFQQGVLATDGIVGPLTLGALDAEVGACPVNSDAQAPSLPGDAALVDLPGAGPLAAEPSEKGLETCEAKANAPLVVATKIACDDRVFKLAKGDSVEVLRRTPTRLKDGSRTVFVKVRVLTGKHTGKVGQVQERFLTKCEKEAPDPCPKSPIGIKVVTSGALEGGLTMDDYYPKGSIPDALRFFNNPGTLGPFVNRGNFGGFNSAAGGKVQIIAQIEKGCPHELFSFGQEVFKQVDRVGGAPQRDEGQTVDDIAASRRDFSSPPHRQIRDDANVTNVSMADFPGAAFSGPSGLGGGFVQRLLLFKTSFTGNLTGRTVEVRWQLRLNIVNGFVRENSVK